MSTLVYVVDDEWIIATTLAAILERSGFKTKTFTCPIEALQAVADLPPDILLTDVSMPEMNGVDLAQSVRDAHPACRVLLFSGQASTAYLLTNARQRGYEFELIAKPIHPADLLAKLQVAR